MMMRAAVALLAFMLVTRAAAAEPVAPETGSVRQACARDVRALCAGIRPGGGRIQQCMVDKREQLSDACKNALQAARAMRKQ